MKLTSVLGYQRQQRWENEINIVLVSTGEEMECKIIAIMVIRVVYLALIKTALLLFKGKQIKIKEKLKMHIQSKT